VRYWGLKHKGYDAREGDGQKVKPEDCPKLDECPKVMMVLAG